MGEVNGLSIRCNTPSSQSSRHAKVYFTLTILLPDTVVYGPRSLSAFLTGVVDSLRLRK